MAKFTVLYEYEEEVTEYVWNEEEIEVEAEDAEEAEELALAELRYLDGVSVIDVTEV